MAQAISELHPPDKRFTSELLEQALRATVEEAFGADWPDVDLPGGVFTVRKAFAKGRLKTYAKTERSRRRVPLRSKVIVSLEAWGLEREPRRRWSRASCRSPAS